MTLSVTATAVADYVAAHRPQPSVDVTVAAIPFNLTNSVTVWRMWNGQREPLRSGRQIRVLGSSLVVTDYEAPFGVATSYQAECDDVLGTPLDSGMSDNVLLPVTNVWISDPFAPTVACSARLSRDSLSTMSYAREGGPLYVVGDPMPVGVVGLRHEAAAIPIKILNFTRSESEAVLAVLRSADPFLMRCPAGYPTPPLMYLTTADIVAARYLVTDGSWRTNVSCTAALVSSPLATALINTRTYADVVIEATTYAGLQALYADGKYQLLDLGA